MPTITMMLLGYAIISGISIYLSYDIITTHNLSVSGVERLNKSMQECADRTLELSIVSYNFTQFIINEKFDSGFELALNIINEHTEKNIGLCEYQQYLNQLRKEEAKFNKLILEAYDKETNNVFSNDQINDKDMKLIEDETKNLVNNSALLSHNYYQLKVYTTMMMLNIVGWTSYCDAINSMFKVVTFQEGLDSIMYEVLTVNFDTFKEKATHHQLKKYDELVEMLDIFRAGEYVTSLEKILVKYPQFSGENKKFTFDDWNWAFNKIKEKEFYKFQACILKNS